MEGVAKEVVVIAVAGPVINLVIRSPYVFLAITLAVIATLAAVLAALIRIQSEISSRWREVMKDPEWWERVPLVGIACLVIAIASLIALILTW